MALLFFWNSPEVTAKTSFSGPQLRTKGAAVYPLSDSVADALAMLEKLI